MICLRFFLFLVLFLSVLSVSAEDSPPPAPKPLTAFSSEQELDAWLLEKKKAFIAWQDKQRKEWQMANKTAELMPASPMLAQAEEESITNAQTAGVDEGGIVKLHGNFLVILRRGRLFTIDIRDRKLDPAFFTDASAPESRDGGWYDELLISGNTVVVIGYSYRKGGTEIVRFTLDETGRLSYKSTHILRSNDYFSSRNYASRLIGNRLIFYTPLYLAFHGDPLDYFPAMRRWDSPEKASGFRRIAPATRIYRFNDAIDSFPLALHTVQICDLSGEEMTCEATAVLGPGGREFYVSKEAVYVWTAPFHIRHDWRHSRSSGKTPAASAVFRLPLDGKREPAALKTRGSPVDQLSFHESGDGHLNVLLRAEGPRFSMWSSEEAGSANLAFFRVSLDRFGDGSEFAPSSSYYPLPPLDMGSVQNRYIGDYLVYGAGNTWRRQNSVTGSAYALNWKNPDVLPVNLRVEHTVDRIEALDGNPLLIGTRGKNLHFSPVHLSFSGEETKADLVDSFVLPNAAQGETRSHGFFYKPDGKDGGILGLPFAGAGAEGWQQIRKASAGVVFLGNDKLQLKKLGVLSVSRVVKQNDNCRVSCVDWYGNSRPLFLKKRIFALMGYELVEGALNPSGEDGHTISEIRRVDFTPRFPSPKHQ
ncbi:MAG: beta-propeller domain-containing protein [Candidatus Accumulibacter sp.]|nr:beta-propeller domain-containing protein [Accumulibacter sp.]